MTVFSPLYILLVAGLVLGVGYVWRRRQRRCAVPAPAVIAAVAQPASARVAPRVAVQWPVTLIFAGLAVQGQTCNISVGGMFVELADPPPLGRVLAMTIEGPGGRLLEVEARIVWSVRHGDANRESGSGMGVMFVAIADEDRDFIAALEN